MTPDDLPPRIRRRIEVDPDGCWLWAGPLTPQGYGRVNVGNQFPPAHRGVWLLVVGPLAADMELHHECGQRACVRPSHMRPLNAADHHRAHMESRETCRAGHPFTPENTYLRTNGVRQCRACKADRQRARYARNPSADIAARAERRQRQRLNTR